MQKIYKKIFPALLCAIPSMMMAQAATDVFKMSQEDLGEQLASSRWVVHLVLLEVTSLCSTRIRVELECIAAAM